MGWIVAGIVLLTIAVVLLAVNLASGEKKIELRIESLYSLDDRRFHDELGVLLGPQFLRGSRLRVLVNGDEIVPAMLAAIRSAKTSITFETYIYWSGPISREFADALIERARAGVKVHVLLDWVGSAKVEEGFVEEMSASGVQIRKFHPPHWLHLGRMNNRTHRKLLVSVGSTNFDNRSFRLNDEATLNIIDAAFAKQQTAIFEADLTLSRPISHAAWLQRPWREKLAERLASLIGNQLQAGVR